MRSAGFQDDDLGAFEYRFKLFRVELVIHGPGCLLAFQKAVGFLETVVILEVHPAWRFLSLEDPDVNWASYVSQCYRAVKPRG